MPRLKSGSCIYLWYIPMHKTITFYLGLQNSRLSQGVYSRMTHDMNVKSDIPQSLVFRAVGSSQKCGCRLDMLRKVCRICSGICLLSPHSQRAVGWSPRRRAGAGGVCKCNVLACTLNLRSCVNCESWYMKSWFLWNPSLIDHDDEQNWSASHCISFGLSTVIP
jgi:hypothetical protein